MQNRKTLVFFFFGARFQGRKTPDLGAVVMEGQGDVAVLPPEGAGLEYPVDAGGGEFPGEGDEYASHGGDEVC